MTKIFGKTLLLIVAMFVALASAQRGGGGAGGGGGGGGGRGPPGGGGGGGGGGRLGGMMMMGGGGGRPGPSRAPVAFTNLGCDEDVGPACAINREGDAGIWVCHTKEDTTTVSACIDPDFAIEGDTCGCCDDTCPEECTCTCTDDEDNEGVLVTFTRDGEEKCMPSANAVSLIAHGKVTCSTTCDETRK